MGAFVMPSLGADMEAGTLVEWLKAPGDAVRRGDIVAVVETQKGAIEIEVFEDGFLQTQLVEIGKTVPVGTPLAMIGDSARAPSKTARETPAAPKPGVVALPAEMPPSKPLQTPPAKASTGEGTKRPRITPAALRLAAEHGLDPASLKASGPGGSIVLADVKARIGETAEPLKAPEGVPGGMREAIAAAMSRSKREIPHYYLSHMVDIQAAEAFVGKTNANRDPEDRLLLGALYLKAVALAAAKYKEFNGLYEESQFRHSQAVHAGMAINIRGGGLVAPAIHDVQQMDLDHLMAAMRDLIQRVRAGRFRAAELADPTITVTSLGERGVETVYGVIYPPQVAIVGFGAPVERPFVSNSGVETRRCVSMTLAADHRVSDGHRGALFLKAIEKWLQQPEAL